MNWATKRWWATCCACSRGFSIPFTYCWPSARADLGGWTVLVYASLTGLPVLLGTALVLGEPIWPTDWAPIVALALTSQVIGQGLLVYALRHFSAFIVGLALMTQPVLAVAVGWAVFGEVLGPLDFLGMMLVGAGLVLARASQD